MTVTSIRKDPDSLSMTITAELDAAPERVWQLWADPRQLERWWGPPEYPATMTAHDLRPGGRVSYHMTGPEDIGGGRTQMSIQSRFPSLEAMEQVLAFGMEEGLKSAVGQIDAILAETPTAQGAAS